LITDDSAGSTSISNSCIDGSTSSTDGIGSPTHRDPTAGASTDSGASSGSSGYGSTGSSPTQADHLVAALSPLDHDQCATVSKRLKTVKTEIVMLQQRLGELTRAGNGGVCCEKGERGGEGRW
jgi:hypothetical protein